MFKCSYRRTVFNGKSQGVCVIGAKEKAILAGHWQIPYEAGTLYAAARDEEGHIWQKKQGNLLERQYRFR